jgi:hypothetical protein
VKEEGTLRNDVSLQEHMSKSMYVREDVDTATVIRVQRSPISTKETAVGRSTNGNDVRGTRVDQFIQSTVE